MLMRVSYGTVSEGLRRSRKMGNANTREEIRMSSSADRRSQNVFCCCAVLAILAALAAPAQSPAASLWNNQSQLTVNTTTNEIVLVRGHRILIYETSDVNKPKAEISTPWRLNGVVEARGDLFLVEYCPNGEDCDYGNYQVVNRQGAVVFVPTDAMEAAGYVFPHHDCKLLPQGDGIWCTDWANARTVEGLSLPTGLPSDARVWFTVDVASSQFEVSWSEGLDAAQSPTSAHMEPVADVMCVGTDDCFVSLTDGGLLRSVSGKIEWRLSPTGSDRKLNLLAYQPASKSVLAADSAGGFVVVDGSTGSLVVDVSRAETEQKLSALFAQTRGQNWISDTAADRASSGGRMVEEETARLLEITGARFLSNGSLLLAGSGARWFALFNTATKSFVGREIKDHCGVERQGAGFDVSYVNSLTRIITVDTPRGTVIAVRQPTGWILMPPLP
jgi:hypothetical protein